MEIILVAMIGLAVVYCGGNIIWYVRYRHKEHSSMKTEDENVNKTETSRGNKKTSGMAIASLICGISSIPLSFLCLTMIFAPAAIVLGHIARTNIRKHPDTVRGRGMALVGLTVGYLSLGITIFISISMFREGFNRGCDEVVAQTQDSGKVCYQNDTLCFSIEVPKNWHDSKVALAQAFAPKSVTLKKVVDYGIIEGFSTVYDGSYQMLVITMAGQQKWPIRVERASQ